jgi:miniconductance mechanosensitive channel
MTSEIIRDWLLEYKIAPEIAELLGLLGAGLYLLILALLANWVAKRFIAGVIHPVIRRTSISWDDLLIEHNVIVRFSHIVPAAILHFLAPTLFETTPRIAGMFQVMVNTYLIIIILFVIDALLNFARALWEGGPVGRRYPAKSSPS